MKQKVSLHQASPIKLYEPTAVYGALTRSPLLREYDKAFRQATGLGITLVPVDQASPDLSFQQSQNPFCRLMARFPGSCSACEQTHAELLQQVGENFAPRTICCFAGLVEFAVPFAVSGQHIATLVGGQVFQRKPTQAQFSRLTRHLMAWGLHSELAQAETLFFETRLVPQKQFKASVQLLMIFTRLLTDDVNRGLLTAQAHDQPCITSAKNFILAHANEPLHLRDVAEHVHVSTYYFCKFFKKTTGIRFSEFLARVRVEKAKDLLVSPGLTISEVADQAGFGSLSQFNRLFHRYVACSPKAYRASLTQPHSI